MNEYSTENYETRLDMAYKKYVEAAEKYNVVHDEGFFAAFNDVLSAYEFVYMEMGIQAGFQLAKDIYCGRGVE